MKSLEFRIGFGMKSHQFRIEFGGENTVGLKPTAEDTKSFYAYLSRYKGYVDFVGAGLSVVELELSPPLTEQKGSFWTRELIFADGQICIRCNPKATSKTVYMTSLALSDRVHAWQGMTFEQEAVGFGEMVFTRLDCVVVGETPPMPCCEVSW